MRKQTTMRLIKVSTTILTMCAIICFALTIINFLLKLQL